MRRRPTLVVSSALALTILALPPTAGAERAATSDIAVVNLAFNNKLKQQILVSDVNGQDIYGWYVVSPLGTAVKRAAVSPSLRVHPTSVARGGRVTVSGRGCIAGDDVFLISTPFAGHAFVAHSVATQTRPPSGAFSRVVRIRTDVRPGRYAITARCGGANLGLAAHLRVY